MERVLTFLLGFVIAGLVGWISSLLLAFWSSNVKKRKQRLSELPKLAPELAPRFSNENNWLILGSILLEGCLRVAWLILFQITLLTSLGGIVFILQRELLPYFYVGIICAFVLGFHLQNIRLNWKKITQLFKIFVNKMEEELKSIKLWFNELQTKLQKLEFSNNDSVETIFASFLEKRQRVVKLKKLIIIKNRRLQKLKEQQALYGISVDPRIPIEIEDIEVELEKLNAALIALEADESSSGL